jgi:hypothetical protein
MGTKILTKERAATLLDCSKRTIQRYLRRGLLKPAFDGRKMGVYEDDVLNLRNARELEHPTVLDRDLVMKLMVKVETLENQMATVLRILNVKFEPLNLSDPEYRSLYAMMDSYSIQGWPPHVEQQMADLFVRFRIEDLEKLERVTEDKHPWRPILRLATTMHLGPWDSALRDQLAAGRTNIHHVAGMWCAVKGDSPRAFDMLVQRDAAPVKKLMRQIGKSRPVVDPPGGGPH